MTFRARGLYASSSKEPRRFRLGPWLVLGALVVAGLVVATAAAVLGNVSVDRGESSDSFAAPEAVEIDNRTGGGVSLTGGGEEVLVERVMRGSPLSDPGERVSEGGGELSLEASCSGVPLVGLFGHCTVDYVVTVPVGTAVRVDTASGPVSTENVDGELRLSTTSGRVDVSGNAADVTVETVSGQVDVSGVEGALVAESTSGRITAEGEGESLRVSTTSGTVEASEFRARTVEVESTSGGVRVGGGFTSAEVSTVSGSIWVDTDTPFDLLSMESTSGSVQAVVPEGSYRVTGDSTSGSRDLEVDTSPGAKSRIDANTVSGSVSITSS
ncbi:MULTISPECIES: DUF4097 family beta strand repeat-containing protein [unclassified Nocardiopsis]|uniref:DUF4097 family beta strand repeat-containing protein n=1 Tax=unclassified Nocardiopsis TaxID=2649073 RepID=UPI00135A0D17|nr:MULTISPECIES: DUF4097 family beta strand repeat-containing protein [unclassified Nocardiopsis]